MKSYEAVKNSLPGISNGIQYIYSGFTPKIKDILKMPILNKRFPGIYPSQTP